MFEAARVTLVDMFDTHARSYLNPDGEIAGDVEDD